MTVAALIEKLSQIEDQDAFIMTPGYEGGYNDVDNINTEPIDVALNVNTAWYYGASGGSGVVIVSYSEAYKAANTTTGSPTYTRTGGNHIYKWNGAGSIKF